MSAITKFVTPGGVKDATLKVRRGSGLVDVARVRRVSDGYGSIDTMLSQDRFYIAHRGGSAVFPEMTEFAYGQSSLYGFPALELSLARTSDGVFFGLHDKTLLRTSGVDIDPATLTWAQVQTYQVSGSAASQNPGQPSRPYMRFEQLAALYPNAVLFMDNKYIPASRYDELRTLIESLIPDAKNRVVAKFFGVSNEWLTYMKGKGYKTWGYFYDADRANYAAYAPKWDMVGLNYEAAQADWDALRAAANPGAVMIGHICPSRTAAETAFGKGADGVMVSGVVSVAPMIGAPVGTTTTSTTTTTRPPASSTTSTTAAPTSTTTTTTSTTTSSTTTSTTTTTRSPNEPPTPAQLAYTDLPRTPASSSVIWWEDPRLSKPQGVDTPLSTVVNQVNTIGQQAGVRMELSLPANQTFWVDDNFGSYGDGLRIGHRDIRPWVRAITGSGRSTVITMRQVTDRQRLVVSSTGAKPDNSLCLLAADQTTAAAPMQVEFANFTLQAPRLVTAANKSTFDATYPGGTNMPTGDKEGTKITSGDIDFHGIRLYRVAPGTSVHHITFRGIAASMGYPPGETWAVNVVRSDGGAADATGIHIHDIEVDGRRPVDNAIVGGCAIGGNKASGVLVERVYAHHTRAGMGLTALWWCPATGETTATTWRFVDCYVDQIQALDRPLYGSTQNTMVNHEQSDGIEYVRCYLGTGGSQVGRTRRLVSLNSDGDTARAAGDSGVIAPDGTVRFIDCRWGTGGVGGSKLSVEYWANLLAEGVQRQRSNPTIIRNGADVTSTELYVEGQLAP